MMDIASLMVVAGRMAVGVVVVRVQHGGWIWMAGSWKIDGWKEVNVGWM